MKSRVTFGSNFDPDLDRVRACVTLSKGMEPFGDIYNFMSSSISPV